MKLWIARDGDGSLMRFTEKPTWDERREWWDVDTTFGTEITPEWFPEIKPGECYEAEIVLKEKEG